MTEGVLKTEPRGRLSWGCGIAGALVSAVVWGLVVMGPSAEVRASTTPETSASGGLGPLELVEVTRTRDAGGTSATMQPRPAAALLVLPPLAGWAIGRRRSRSRAIRPHGGSPVSPRSAP